jgi:hypothetical protein
VGLSLESADTLGNLEGQERLQKEFYMTGKAELAKQIGQAKGRASGGPPCRANATQSSTLMRRTYRVYV